MKRRYPALVLAVCVVAGAVAVGRRPTEAEVATFSVAGSGWMPHAPMSDGLTETWFCPGVPATGVEDVGGSIVVANRSSEQLEGTVVLFNERSESVQLTLDVDGWGAAQYDLDATLPGEMVGAVVEIEGAGALVEQRSTRPSGDSVAPCANATSDTWYFADGFTVDGSLDQIVLSNPYDQTVVANLEFATREGPHTADFYSGLTVPARSTRVIDLGAPGAGAQGEPILAVKVEATRGRLVAGRSQWALGGGRLGTNVTLGSPALREQWWFAGGLEGETTSERYSIYNPTDDPVEVDAVFVGIAAPVVPDPITVPAHEVVTYDPAIVGELPDGRYAIVFSALGNPSIVVERATTEMLGDIVASSVIAGATARQDGYVASVWYLAAGPAEPIEDALVVYNADNTPATVSVQAIGSGGPVPVTGLDAIDLPAASVITIDLTDELTLNRPLVVESTGRVFVERAFPTGRGDTRQASWAIPAG